MHRSGSESQALHTCKVSKAPVSAKQRQRRAGQHVATYTCQLTCQLHAYISLRAQHPLQF
jgi:hypothetical protein